MLVLANDNCRATLTSSRINCELEVVGTEYLMQAILTCKQM